MPYKEDRRVRKTKAQLRRCFAALLREKNIKDITVRELTDLADINRGTFYCHYRDIYDLAEQIEGELFEEFTALMNAYSAKVLRVGLRSILQDIFRFVEKNADMCAVMLGGGDSTFFQRLKAVVYEKGIKEWGGIYAVLEPEVQDYYLDFLVGGTVGLLQSWVAGGRKESAAELAAMTEKLILGGIRQQSESP